MASSQNKTLAEGLLSLITESAEYSHPLDEEAPEFSKATGHVTIQELVELLRKHGESITPR